MISCTRSSLEHFFHVVIWRRAFLADFPPTRMVTGDWPSRWSPWAAGSVTPGSRPLATVAQTPKAAQTPPASPRAQSHVDRHGVGVGGWRVSDPQSLRYCARPCRMFCVTHALPARRPEGGDMDRGAVKPACLVSRLGTENCRGLLPALCSGNLRGKACPTFQGSDCEGELFPGPQVTATSLPPVDPGCRGPRLRAPGERTPWITWK